jgi:hypothetical protein
MRAVMPVHSVPLAERSRNRQDRSPRKTDDCLSNAAEKGSRQTVTTMSTHDDEVRIPLLGNVQDRGSRLPHCDYAFNVRAMCFDF